MSEVRVSDVLLAAGQAAFTNDDQEAIRSGRPRDGFFYGGAPQTAGFRRVRQAADALSIILVLDDGATMHGDAVSVQYAGAAGREAPLDAARSCRTFGRELRRAFGGADVSSFRASSERLATLDLPTSVRYGLSQALLAAAAHAGRRTIAETIAAEYDIGGSLRRVPIFAQCGENRRTGVDRMVLRRVDELPHGLINNVDRLVGRQGERLAEYVRWVRDRVVSCRESDDYEPVLHFDVYGTLGRVFPELERCADYLARLGEAAAPLRLRIEQPAHAHSRDDQIELLARLRTLVHTASRSQVQLVADEWCNTLDDVTAFVGAGAADMVQVKTPDLGSLDDAVQALLVCKRGGVAAYCGGSCTDTERAAQVCAGVAMGVDADLLLARPGMGVDEAVMVVSNEMSRTRALIEARPYA
jgi:methylaspartate ammonia-lyase